MTSDEVGGFINYFNLVIITGIILSLSYLITYHVVYKDDRHHIYVITPVEDLSCIDHLRSVGRVLRSLEHITWLVVENSETLSTSIGEVLMRMNVPFERLSGELSFFQKYY